MPAIPRSPRRLPRTSNLLDLIETTETRLSELVGRWFDGIPAEVRVELHAIRQPLTEALIAAGRMRAIRPP